MRNILAIFLFCLYTVTLQAGIKGIILDNSGQPVVGASIVVYNSDNKIQAFTSSHNDGHFFIDIDLKVANHYLVVSLLGYKTEKISITDVDKSIRVTLYQENVELNEVVVKAKPMYQYNDTTQYVVSAFSDGLEKNIEELLKKLPGIDVGENGNISFKGKPISKILLDQADMFGENYKVASKTIPVQFVSTIEAINHYQENRLLKGVQSSDDVVLNLSLKPDMNLRKPVGLVSLDGGVKRRYDVGGNMMLMNRKFKFYDAVEFANVAVSGLSPADQNDDLAPVEVVGDCFYSFANRDNVKYAEQKSKRNNLSLIWQPVPALSVKNRFLAEGIQYSSGSHETIRYISGDATIDHFTLLKNRPVIFDNSIETKYDNGKATILTMTNQLAYNNKHTDNRFIEEAAADYVVRNKSTILKNSINLSHSFKNAAALLIDFSNVVSNGGQGFNFSNTIVQQIDAKRMKNAVAAKYLKRHKSWEWNVAAGYRYRAELLKAETSYRVGKQFADYKETLFFTQSQTSLSLGNAKIELGALLGYWSQKINTGSLGNSTKSKLKIMPEFTIDYGIKKHHFSLSCVYEPNKINPMDYITRYSDDRQLFETAPSYNYKMGDMNISSSYVFTPSLSTMLMAMYLYTLSRNSFVYNYDIRRDMDLTKPVALSNNHRHFIMFSASQYVDAIRHGLRCSVNYNVMDYHNLFAGEAAGRVNTASLISKISVRSSFNFPLNYVAGGRYSFSSYNRDRLKRKSTHTYSLFQELLCKTSTFKAKLAFDEHFLGKERHFYFFISPDIRYEWKKYHLTMGLRGYNILNHKSVKEYLLTDIYSREYNQDIVPAYCLFHVSVRY